MCFDSITHTAEAEYATAKTGVWWDIENCPVPKGWDAHTIAQKLNSTLVNLNYRGPLSISAYGNTDLIPKAVQQALSSTGISLNHVPSGKKDASDKKILVDMFLWVLDNPAPANLMLISGDGDFSDALHRLRMRRYNILLAHPLQASPSLVASARTSWMWRSLLSSGCPSTRSCSFDSEIFSEDVSVSVSEGVLSTTQVMESVSGSSKAERKKLKDVLKGLNQQETTKRKKLQKKCSECEWLCRVCNVTCKSIEETVQDSDQEESMKQLEKQYKQLMESITTSERSEREFWHDFKERLDKNGVAPLSVDHVFSELSRVFSVPREVRQCFEAIFKKLGPTQNDIEIEKLKDMLKIESGESENAPENLKGDMTKKKKSTVTEDKYEPFLCSICNVICDHPAMFESHHKGRKHTAKFNKHIDDLLDNHQKQGETIQDNSLAKDMTVIVEGKAEPYVSSICNVVCDHPSVFESHHKGRKHAAKVKKHTEALLDDHQKQEETIQDKGLLKDMTKELQIKPVETPENMDYLDKQREELKETFATSERSVEEFFQTIEEVRENDYKSLPNADCIFTELNPEARNVPEVSEDAIFKKPEVSQDANLTPEFESTPKGNLEMNSSDPESSSAGASEHPEEENMDMEKDKVTKDKADLKEYVCSICSVICLSPSVFESHLMGKKHAKRVKKHAEVLFDDKKIVEQSQDHPRDALEGLQIEPKDAQVSIKEVSQLTKARVDTNEDEQILSVEFPEDKEASREWFDSIVKRYELFMEKTSEQTLVESENASERVEEVVGTEKENGVAAAQIRVCELCNVMCNTQMAFDSHLASKRHAAKTQIRVCAWCNVMCHKQEDFDLHLGGKRHAATLKKHMLPPLLKKEVAVV